MITGLKRLFALILVLTLVMGLLPAVNVQAEEAQVISDAAYADADLVLDGIDEALSAPAKKDSSTLQKIWSALQVVASSDSYVEGSLELSGASFTWMTDSGIRCIYSPRMRKIREAQKAQGIDAIVNEPVATKGGSPTGKQVYLIGPYYGYDENFTDQYKIEARRVAAALGDTDGYTLYSGNSATIDKVAEAISNGAVVFFDSHGATDYQNPNNEYDCSTKATTSYLCLHTATGLTTQDYNDGAAYDGDAYVTGKIIANHMTKNSPSGLLWMAICLGMATDSMYKPMREMGVEVVYGYSESVTFYGDYLWEETFWEKMLDGSTMAQAVAAMKETWGYWDWSGEMAQYYGYSYYQGYTTISEARNDFSAFPVVVSDEDTWPGKRTTSSYGASSLQTVKSTYTLGELQEVTTPTDPRQILEEAYALSPGEELPYTPTLTGTVTQITTAYSSQYGNITVIMEVEDCEDLPIKCYRLQGSGVEQIAVGDRITVTGTVVNYQHSSGDTEVEFAQGCTLLARTPAEEIPTDPAPEETYTVSFSVPSGVPVPPSMECSASGIVLPTPESSSPEYTFAGWATEPVSETTTPPPLYVGLCAVNGDVTLYAVYVRTEGGDGRWNLVTDASLLTAGTRVVIAAADYDYALSITQNSNNRAAAAIAKNGTTIEINDEVQVFTLEEGTAAGSFAFYTGNGYIYTNDTGNNRLRTQTGLDAYASFTVEIADSGVATIQNVGNISRGLLQFNQANVPHIFSCYSGGQQNVALYAQIGTAYYTSTPFTCQHTALVEWPAQAPTCTQEGCEAGIYCMSCGTFLEGGADIPALGHSYSIVVTAPTATAMGYTTYTCTTCGYSYSDNYVPALGTTYTVTFAAPQGVPIPASMSCNNAGITLPTPAAPEGYTFVGWAESAIIKTEQMPLVYTGHYQAQADITLYAVYSIKESVSDGQFQLVTDASQLRAGSQVIITAAGYDKALSLTQNTNNRAAASITKTGNTLTYGSDTAVLQLRDGTVSGSFAFYDSSRAGFLYAASSKSNYLRTEGYLTANSSWKITVSANGTASVVAQGSNSRKVMQYNNNDILFGCYASASQKPVSIYVRASDVIYYTSLDASPVGRVQVGEHTYNTIAEALNDASGDYITLLADVEEDISLFQSLILDLNGHVLTGDISVERYAELQLFDSATADYTADRRGAVVGNIEGPLAATMNTPASYGPNYKYLTIREADGRYTAHRIYLSVQSIMLNPANTGISYKTVFKCNDVVAQYTESFGVRVAEQEFTFTTSPAGGTNYGTINVGNVLNPRNLEATAANAYTDIPLAPVLVMKDGLQSRVEATEVNYSLQDVVRMTNAAFDTLTEKQQHALQYMYTVYESIMSTWPDTIVGNFKG